MKRTSALLSVIVINLIIFSSSAFATLVPKINNQTQAELTLQTGCVGSDLYFTGSVQNLPPVGPVTYPSPRWTGSGAFYLNNPDAPNVTFNCPIPGDYEITYSAIEGGTTYSITQYIKVVNKDILTLVSPAVLPYNVCEATSFMLEASGTKYYYWEREKDAVIIPLGTSASFLETPPTFGTWTYRVYGGNDGCESDPTFIEFQVIVDQPATADAGGTYSTCAGVGVSLNGSIGGAASSAEWVGGAGTFTPNRTTLNATYTPHASESGTNVVLILRTDDPAGVCTYAESSATVTVNTLPAAPTAGNVTACYDGAAHIATATAPANSSVVWYTNAVGGTVTTAPTGTAAGTYTAWAESVDDVTLCASSTRTLVTLTINALPAAPIASNVTVCYDGASHGATATAPGGSSVVWYTDAVGGTVTTAPTGTAVGTYTAWAESVDDVTLCASSSRTLVTLTINVLPAAPTAVNITTCYDGASHSATATAPADASVVWYTESTGGVLTTAPTGTAAGTYTAWAESVGDLTSCVSATRTLVTLTINALPLAPTAGNVTVCYDGASHSATATAPAGSSVAWYDNAVGGSSTTAPTATAAGTYTAWAVSIDDITGCESANPRTEVTLKINALPAAPTAGNVTVCYDGASHSATATVLVGSSLAWYTAAVGGVLTTAPTGTAAGTYTAWAESVETATGCASSTRTLVTLTINALPAAPTAGNVTVCYDGAAHSATANAPANASVVWYTASMGGVLTTAPTGTAAGTYTAWAESVGDLTGCVSATRTLVTLTINALPAAPTAVNVTTCYDGASHSATATAPVGSSVVWYDNSIGGNLTTAPTGTAVGIYNAWAVSVNTTTGCQSAAPRTEVTLTINTLPSAPTANNEVFCYDGASHSASATPPAGASVVWYDNAIGGNLTTAPTGTAVGVYTAWAESVYGASSCSSDSRTQVTLTINPLPTQFNVTGGGSYCAGDAGALVGLSGSQSGVTYTLYKGGLPTPTSVVGDNNPISFGLQTSGTYTVQAAFNATSCSIAMIGSAVVTEIPAITGNTITADQVICSGSTPAQLTGPEPTGGSGGYLYQWQISTTSATGPFTNIMVGAQNQNYSPSALTQTTYYRRMVTSGPCSDFSNAVTIEVNPPISNNTIAAAQTICYNTTPAELTGSTPTGGNGTYTYIWEESTTGAMGPFTSTGVTSANYQPGSLTQDTWYRRLVTSLPCTDNTSNVIKITVSPEFTITGITSVSPTCNGYNDGSATVNTLGGIAPYTYSWNTTPVQTDQTATGLLAGVNYTVTVTDAALCSVIGNITLTEPAPISLGSVTANAVTGCFGDTNGSIQIEANGGTPNYVYALYNGATLVASQTPVFPAGANFTGLGAGTYSVNITDINSCPAYIESNIVVSEPPQLVIDDVIITDVVCHGESTGTLTIMATGGTGSISYSISGEFGTYQPSNFFNGLPSGDYDIWVKDANGCTASWGNVFIASPEAISVSASFKVITSCHNDNTGEITISPYPGALTDYDYTLAQFPTPADWGSSNVYLGLAAGNYYPQVRQISSGCVAKLATSPIIITQPDPIDFTVIKVDVTTCSYNTNGSIRVQGVTGGTGPYKTSRDNVQWFNTPYTFTGLGVGNYEILVKDIKGCIAKKDVALTGPAPIVVTSLTSTDPTCFGATNGTVSIAASGGTGELEYSIDGVTYIKIVAPATQAVFNGLKAGLEYTVYIKDANGCINQDTKVTLSQPLVLYFTQQDVTPITCNTANDGKIILVAAGGNPPYSYTITAGAISFTDPTGVFNNLPAGKYTVSVTDLNGCVTVGTDLTVAEPDPITIIGQSSTDILCHGETSGTITVDATGGTSPLVYNLYSGAVLIASNDDGDFTGLGIGTYTVEVTDANSCGPVLVGPFTISEPPLLEFTYTKVDLTCYNDGTGQITVNATGGTLPYEYSFDGGANFDINNIQGGLNGGDFTVIVRDANQCKSTQVVTINAPDELILTLDVTNISCGGLSDGKIVANAIGGSTATPYQYRLNSGTWQLDNTFTGLNANTYTIEVLDDKGCTDIETGVIAEPVPVGLDPTSTTVNPTCTTPGSITAVGTGGTGPYTYTLNPGTADEIVNTSGFFDNLPIGSYVVHIKDVYNCGSFIWNVDLTGPPTLSVSASPTSILCNGGTSTITVTAIGGTAPFQYSVDDQATYIPDNNVFPNLVAGTYEVWVKDANNCTAHTTVNITQPDALILGTPVVIQESGVGTNDGSISVTATGGTGLLTYTLIPLGTTNNTGTFTGLGAGTYRVSVADINGCSDETLDLVIGGMSIDLTLTHLTCNASNNGSIKIVINGGVTPYNVLCTLLPLPGTPVTVNPTADPKEFIAEGLAAGEYNITVADNIGNIRSQQVQILEPAPLVVTLVQKINPSCNGDTGSIIFDIDGGVPVSIVGSDSLYTIDLIRDGVVEATLTDTVVTGILPNVKYDFKISDANSCFVLVDTIQPLTEPEAIVVAGFTKEDILCNGQAQGKITITASGGAGNLTYKLVDPVSGVILHENTTGEFVDLMAGSYNLVVEDINTCSATVGFNPIVLTEPTAIMISGGDFPTDSLQCPYSTGGYVRNVNVTGGTPFAAGDGYLYLWTNGLTTKDVEDLPIGIHTLTVTDGNGCKQTQDYTILGPDTLKLDTKIDPADCKLLWARTNPGETEITDIGQIAISNSKGGNGTFSDLKFLWNYPESDPSTSNVLSKLTGGTYTLKVTDKKLCEYTFDYVVPLNPRYDYTVDSGADTTVCYNNPVILHGDVTGGDPDLTFTYNWFLVPQTDGQPLHVGKDLVITTTGSKKYLLEVVDSDGACKDTSYIDVSVLPEIGLHVPLYVSAVQDTIISVLMGKEFNLDVITKSVEYETTFQWKPAEMFRPNNSWNSNIIFNEEIKQQIPADRFVTLQDPLTRRYNDYILVDVIAKTSLGCTDSIRLYTKIVTDLAFGNVFSPNGDGINDIWSVPKDYLFPDLEIEIFNRWGSLVWSAKGDKAARGWNGRTNSGNELPIGTYYYVVKFNAKAQGSGWKPITGSVTIVK